MVFDQITLPNGLRIIGERIDHFHSVSVGLWVGSGSQYESSEEAGLSHFLEHMVFKGTAKRTARQIAEEMDAVGGQLNAFTAKESTCFYAKVVDDDLPLAMDVIADMATAPTFDPGELEKEKGVVIEEIAMSEDTPEDLANELLLLAHYGDQPVARPILGTQARIRSCTREDLAGYWSRMYRPQNAVLALAGRYDWDAAVALAEKLLGGWSAEGLAKRACVTQPVAPTILTREKDIEQAHICLGFPGLTMGDERAYALTIANSVFGGAMSSRLFQRIREERGLVYTVYSYPSIFTDTGMMSLYAATNPENAGVVIDLLLEESRRMAEDGLTEAEFDMAQAQVRASYILRVESTSSRMQGNGRRLLLRGDTRTDEEVLERIDAVRLEDANALMRELLTAPHSMSLVGKGAEKIAERAR